MIDRIEVQKILESALGSTHVYFQPPETIKMKYPCIRYSIDTDNVKYANDKKYKKMRKYSVILIDKNPDSLIVEKLSDLRYATLNNVYASEGLNHFAFTIFF